MSFEFEIQMSEQEANRAKYGEKCQECDGYLRWNEIGREQCISCKIESTN